MKTHAAKFLLLISVGVVLRFILINSSYQADIAARVEVSTPVSGWKRGKRI